MRYPEFLSEGGTIGFVAPSFGCATEPYKTAFGMTIKRFEKEGYTIELGPNCYEDKGIGISNTPQECGSICAILSGVIKPNATIYIRTYELKESSIIP